MVTNKTWERVWTCLREMNFERGRQQEQLDYAKGNEENFIENPNLTSF